VFQGYGLGMVAGMAILLIIVLKFGL